MAAYGDVGLGLLGDPTRRTIFELLARRPCSVQGLNPEGVTALRAWLDGVWGDVLASFHKAAETAGPDPEQENS